jgi:hypothetical protein
MFILQSATGKTISWPVTVEVAVDGGKLAKYTFNGTFKVLSDDEREALAAGKVQAPALDAPLDGADDQNALVTATAIDWKEAAVDGVLEVMTDWSGVVDQNKTPIPFNRDNLLTAARSAAGIGILRGINTAIQEITTGARAKN